MPLSALLIDAALLALIVVALGFMIAGIVLILRPDRFTGPDPGSPLHWLLEPLETPRQVERFLYRHHRVFGTLLVGCTAYFLWRMARIGFFGMPVAAEVGGLLLWLLTIACGITLLIGIVIMVRPSGLKPVESWANRWVAWRGSRPQRWLARHPRTRGLLVFFISGYCFVIFTWLFVERVAGWAGRIQ